MEKYNAYSDPGTGIQPFLTRLPPAESSVLVIATLPLRYALAAIRTVLVLAIVLVYVVAQLLCRVFYPVQPIYRVFDRFINYILCRMILFILGVIWISAEQFTRKRSRRPNSVERWKPKAGDIIVSNWVSWLEILWLNHKFNPIFVIPIPEAIPEQNLQEASSVTQAPRRRTHFGPTQRLPRTPLHIPIRGFQTVSFFQLICMTGFVPPFKRSLTSDALPLEEIRQRSSRPLLVFPECTSSNGRGLLRFASVFRQSVPVKNYQVFVMCVRYDPPAALAPTLSHSLPSNVLNPFYHLFSIASSLVPAQITIKLLAPSESPGSPLFLTSELLSDYTGNDQLSEACSILIAQMGKLKRIGMGWEDKSLFLDFYKSKVHE